MHNELPMQQRVQLEVMSRIAANMALDQATVMAACPGSDERDIARALELLIREGSVDAPSGGSYWLVRIAAYGRFTLNPTGWQRLAASAS